MIYHINSILLLFIYYIFIYEFSGDWGCETLKNQKIVNDVDDVNSIDKKQERGKLITTRMNFQLKSIELEEFQRIELLSQIETIGNIYIYIYIYLK